MIKKIILGVFLCLAFNATADCFDELDPNKTIREKNIITLEDAKRCSDYVLKNVRFDSNAVDEDCFTSDDKRCFKTACNLVFHYLDEHYGIPNSTKSLFPNEDFYALFLIHTFSESSNLTPTLDGYKSFLNYMVGLYDASDSNSQSKDKDFSANRSVQHLDRVKQWKAAGNLDSVANVGYKNLLRINTSRNMNTYLDSVTNIYEVGAPLVLDVKIKDKEFENITDELRLKLLKCQAYSFICDKKGINNKDVERAKSLLDKWKKIHTDRFGEILLEGDKKYYISNYLVHFSLTECGNEMNFDDYYKMIQDILIENQEDQAFSAYLNMYKERTLYEYLRNIYLRNIAVVRK